MSVVLLNSPLHPTALSFAALMNGLFEIRLGISGAYGRAIVNGLFRPRVLFYKGRDSPVRFDTQGNQ
jgi:hypothetical protein